MTDRGDAQTIVPSLTDEQGGHWTRDVAFSLDGKHMFVSVGSGSNVAEGGSDERDRADVLVFDPQGRNKQVFASGIRNCVGLAVHATTGDLWCSTNERDGLGGDLEDPRHTGERPDLAGTIVVPDVLLQAHSASLQMTFYDGSAFPSRYRGA